MNTPLTGTYRYTIDRKNRVVMPQAFRPFFGAGCWLTRGCPGTLIAYTADRHPQYTARWLADHSDTFLHLGSAVWRPFCPNTQRFHIPHELFDLLKLRPLDDVALTGLGDGVLIQSWARWDHDTAEASRWLLGRWSSEVLQGRLDLVTR